MPGAGIRPFCARVRIVMEGSFFLPRETPLVFSPNRSTKKGPAHVRGPAFVIRGTRTPSVLRTSRSFRGRAALPFC